VPLDPVFPSESGVGVVAVLPSGVSVPSAVADGEAAGAGADVCSWCGVVVGVCVAGASVGVVSAVGWVPVTPCWRVPVPFES
jgi:hypothetical protein